VKLTPRRSRTARTRTAAVLIPVVAVLAALAGCGSRSVEASTAAVSTSAYTVVSAPALTPGDAVPSPTGPVILTVSGRVDAAEGARTISFDLATLESIGLVEYAVDDDVAEGRTATFRGVLLSRLLAVVGMHDATTLHMVALNDYAVDIPATDPGAFPVLLATSVDGSRMPIEEYGPTRVIYPTDDAALNPTVYDPRRIWQLMSIEVR